MKWVAKENIHLTLKFLGEVGNDKIETIKTILDNIAVGERSFQISLNGVGLFPNADFPKIVWVGLGKGSGEASHIAVKIDEELSKIGFQRESRLFVSHLTLGRLRSGKNRDALKEKILSVPHSPESHKPEIINSIILFKSTLTPQGSIYEKVHESRLAE